MLDPDLVDREGATMAKDSKPSSAGIWIGAVMIVLSFVAGIGGFVLGGMTMVSSFNDMAAVREGTTATVQLQAKEYWIYGTSNFGGPDVTVTDPSGNPVTVRVPTIDGTYTSGSTTYNGFGEFDAPVAGEYTIDVEEGVGTRSSSNEVLIGPPIDSLLGQFFLYIGGGSAIAFVLFVGGLILLIVSAVRRSRWNKQQRPPMGGGYGQPQYGQPGGYGAPGGYQPPPAPGGYQPPPAPGGYQPPPTPGGYQPPAPGGVVPPPPPGGPGPGAF